jgi:hypothetical protein
MNEASDNQYNSRENMQAEEPRVERDGTPRWVWLSVIVLAAVSVLGPEPAPDADRRDQLPAPK